MKNLNVQQLKLMVAAILLVLGVSLQSCEGSGKAQEGQTVEVPSIPISTAVFTGNLKVVKQHIAAKSDLNEKDEYGSLPLTIAATFGKTDVALALIEGGADLNAQSSDGSTPLHTAAFFGRVEIVESLLAKNADVTIRNGFGSTALESVDVPFNDVRAIYDQLSRDLGMLGLKLDYDKLKEQRVTIANMIRKQSN